MAAGHRDRWASGEDTVATRRRLSPPNFSTILPENVFADWPAPSHAMWGSDPPQLKLPARRNRTRNSGQPPEGGAVAVLDSRAAKGCRPFKVPTLCILTVVCASRLGNNPPL